MKHEHVKLTMQDVRMLLDHADALTRPDAPDAGKPFRELADRIAKILNNELVP